MVARPRRREKGQGSEKNTKLPSLSHRHPRARSSSAPPEGQYNVAARRRANVAVGALVVVAVAGAPPLPPSMPTSKFPPPLPLPPRYDRRHRRHSPTRLTYTPGSRLAVTRTAPFDVRLLRRRLPHGRARPLRAVLGRARGARAGYRLRLCGMAVPAGNSSLLVSFCPGHCVVSYGVKVGLSLRSDRTVLENTLPTLL